jgi:hypothetical protein
MRTVLLTCGRGTYSLTLARSFRAAGCTVLVADAWPYAFCRFSAAVEHYVQVPSPALQTSEWIDAILQIVDEHAVELIVPVYEDAFYLAEAFSMMPDPPRLFAPDFETLIGLHNKWQFNQTSLCGSLWPPPGMVTNCFGSLAASKRRWAISNGTSRSSVP